MPPQAPETALREIQELADRRYQGRLERAFVDWTMRCLLPDLDLEDDDFTAMSAIDGPGDLGIDAIRLDEANNRLILVQCKFRDRATRGEVQEFRKAIEALKDEAYVHEHGNARIKEVYPEVQEPLLDEDFSIYAVFAVGEQTAPAAATWAGREGSEPWIFEFGGTTRRKEFQAQVFNIEALVSFRNMLTAAATTPVVTLHVAQSPTGPCIYEIGGEFKAIQATVPAQDIVTAYATHRSAIFRYNPRGPQGSNKVNKEIEATLSEPEVKDNFHLLNNGLTVVCDGVTYEPNSRVMTVADFQIVNGCQTAYTLHAKRADVTDDVLVGVRVIEGENWAPMIAKSTNSQTAVRPEQLASLGTEHDRTRDAFDALDAPWYYERQQGSRRFQTAIERQLHRARYGDRVVTIKEVGQFGASFVGYPILAKYDLKALFERSDTVGQRLYSALFGLSAAADQLLLPVLVGRQVHAVVRQRIQQLEEERTRRTEQAEETGFSEIDWLPYARMHLVALIGVVLRTETPEHATNDQLLATGESRRRRVTMDEWFAGAFGIARDAVEYRIDVAREADQLTNLREFFRNDDLLSRMTERARERARRR